MLAAVPCGLAWAVRRARIEGRKPVWALVGLVKLLTRPTRGQYRGRALSWPRSATLSKVSLPLRSAPVESAAPVMLAAQDVPAMTPARPVPAPAEPSRDAVVVALPVAATQAPGVPRSGLAALLESVA